MQIAVPDTSVVADTDVLAATIWKPYDYDVIFLYYEEGKRRGQLGFAACFASSRRLRVLLNQKKNSPINSNLNSKMLSGKIAF